MFNVLSISYQVYSSIHFLFLPSLSFHLLFIITLYLLSIYSISLPLYIIEVDNLYYLVQPILIIIYNQYQLVHHLNTYLISIHYYFMSSLIHYFINLILINSFLVLVYIDLRNYQITLYLGPIYIYHLLNSHLITNYPFHKKIKIFQVL